VLSSPAAKNTTKNSKATRERGAQAKGAPGSGSGGSNREKSRSKIITDRDSTNPIF
jgi:hypothetical protein